MRDSKQKYKRYGYKYLLLIGIILLSIAAFYKVKEEKIKYDNEKKIDLLEKKCLLYKV